MRQVLLSLVSNASEAIGGQDGHICVSTCTATLDDEDLREMQFPNSLAPGSYAALVVTDSGPGMEPPVMARIFDPFYSTKFLGRGLGLAAVQGIVRSHKGGLLARSNPGKGSTFSIFLPFVESKCARPPLPGVTALQREMTVLVIDDEDSVREVTKRMLEGEGCQVFTAVDGVNGVEEFQKTHGKVDVVLLDLTMPRMGGVQACHKLRRIKPDVKVLLMSGYTEEDAVGQFKEQRLAGFIQKPFSMAELKQKLRAILESRPLRP